MLKAVIGNKSGFVGDVSLNALQCLLSHILSPDSRLFMVSETKLFFLVQLIVRLRRFLGSDVLSKSKRVAVGGSQILTNVLLPGF